MTYIELFVLLQILDFMTTLVGLRMGGAEMSPFISLLMKVSDPVIGLALAKAVGFLLAGVCLWMNRTRVIYLVNYFFAVLVVWNLYMILRGLGVVL